MSLPALWYGKQLHLHRRLPDGGYVQVIVGLGRHSVGGVARILPAVVRYLTDAGYSFREEPDNAGACLSFRCQIFACLLWHRVLLLHLSSILHVQHGLVEGLTCAGVICVLLPGKRNALSGQLNL